MGAERATGGPRQADVNFRSGEVDVDADLATLQLRKDVVLTVDRYRLSSECVQLRRGPLGIEITGDGRMSLCRCANTPATLRLDSATVAPPTDLLIRNPVLEIGGVPVGWLPVMWLRSRERSGLLPARLAWRGSDGAYGDAGFHWPFGAPLSRSSRTLDVRVGGYLKGGVTVAAQLQTPTSTTSVGWDRLQGDDGWSLASHGTVGPSDRASLAWRGSWARGGRAYRITDELGAAAERWDQGTVAATLTGWRGVAALQLRQVGERWGSWDELGSGGPALVLGGTKVIGRGLQLDATSSLWTRNGAGVTESWVTGEGAVSGSVRPGPARVDLSLDSATLARLSDAAHRAGAEVGTSLRAGLPLVRAWPQGVVHEIEPFVAARAAHRYAFDTLEPGDGWRPSLRATAGLLNAVENRTTAGAGSLQMAGGVLLQEGRQQPLAQASSVIDERLGALGATAEVLPLQTSTWTVTGRARVGKAVGWRLDLWADGVGSGSLIPRDERAAVLSLIGDRSRSVAGWSAGAATTIPFARWFAVTAGGDRDLTAGRWLDGRTGVLYRHPCGCLAVGSRASWRLAGRGTVVDMTVDLMP